MPAIVSDDYRKEQEALKADPIIQKMATEMTAGIVDGKIPMSEFEHESGTPRHEFMRAATDEYVKRCGAGHTPVHHTIGGPATAILALVHEGLDIKP